MASVEYQAQRRQEKAQRGECQDCEALAEPERVRCADCLSKRASQTKVGREARKQAGQCTRCKRKARKGKTTCKVCGQEEVARTNRTAKRRREDRQRQGLCPRCGERPPVAGDAECRVCKLTLQERYRTQREAVMYEATLAKAEDPNSVVPEPYQYYKRVK